MAMLAMAIMDRGPLLDALPLPSHWATYTRPKVQNASLYCSLATWSMLGQSDD